MDLLPDVVNHINQVGNEIISIDIPSGLFVDKSSKGNHVVKANHTLAFQCQKLAFMVGENSAFIGNVHILDIGLDPTYLETIQPLYNWVDQQFIRPGFINQEMHFRTKEHTGILYWLQEVMARWELPFSLPVLA